MISGPATDGYWWTESAEQRILSPRSDLRVLFSFVRWDGWKGVSCASAGSVGGGRRFKGTTENIYVTVLWWFN